MKKVKNGFSLIELLFTMALLAATTGMAIDLSKGSSDTTILEKAQSFANPPLLKQEAIDAFVSVLDNGAYLADISELEEIANKNNPEDIFVFIEEITCDNSTPGYIVEAEMVGVETITTASLSSCSGLTAKLNPTITTREV